MFTQNIGTEQRRNEMRDVAQWFLFCELLWAGGMFVFAELLSGPFCKTLSGEVGILIKDFNLQQNVNISPWHVRHSHYFFLPWLHSFNRRSKKFGKITKSPDIYLNVLSCRIDMAVGEVTMHRIHSFIHSINHSFLFFSSSSSSVFLCDHRINIWDESRVECLGMELPVWDKIRARRALENEKQREPTTLRKWNVDKHINRIFSFSA